MTSICCERCNAGIEVNQYDSESLNPNLELRLQEVTMSFGVTTMLCYKCRKAWSIFSVSNELFKKFNLCSFRLECWKTKWTKDGGDSDELLKGEKLFKDMQDADAEALKLTLNWIRAGAAASEK